MPIIYGYARCSTDEEHQDIKRQERELKALGVKEDEHIFKEYVSGTKTDRDKLNKLLEIAQEGDTIVTTEVSRLTRSTSHLCSILQIVRDKHLILNIGGSFLVDCSQGDMDPMTEGMVKMWGVFAEMERNIISQRVKSGMKNAKAKGKKIGRPTLSLEKLPKKFLQGYPLYKKGVINISDLSRMVGCSRTTIYGYIKLLEKA